MLCPEDLSESLGQRVELFGDRRALQEGSRHLCEERLLTLTLLGLGRAAAHAGRKIADDDSGDEEDRERHPVLGIREGERVERWQEEEVEGQHARDRRGNGVREPPDDRDRYDREEVQRDQADGRCDDVEPVDDARDEGDHEDAGSNPEPVR